MTDERPAGGEQDDPLRRAVEQYWDDIRRLAGPRRLEQLHSLLAGTADADPGIARTWLTDILFDVLPPGHPVIRVLRSSPAYDRGGTTGPAAVAIGEDHLAGAAVLAGGDAAGTMPVTIYLTDERYHAQVESAVEALFAAAGLWIADRDDPVIGSWFRRMTVWAKDGTRPPAGQDDPGSRRVLAQDAEVTAKLLENLAPVIAALGPVKGAVVRAGALLVVKHEDDISVLQLTAVQQARLDDHPQLARSPHEIVAALGLVGDDRPGADEGAVLDLYAEQPALGQDSRFRRETRVSFGRLRVAAVPDDELPTAGHWLALPRMRITEIVVPFDLEEPPDGCRYTEITVRMTFDSPDVEALTLSRPPAQTGADDSDDSVLDTRGVGRQRLAWKLSARDEQSGMRPSSREVLAVVGTPIAAGRLTGALDVSIRFTGQAGGAVRRSAAEPRQPLLFALDVTDGTFEVLSGGEPAAGA